MTANPDTDPSPTPPGILLLAVSFLGGFQIMVLEVAGFRMLQTHLGSSVIVTGTLLTLVMVLLSGGYYLGGRLNRIGVRALSLLLLLAALYTQAFDVLYPEAVADWSLGLRDRLYGHPFLDSGLPAALLSLALYGPPVFLMSTISPFLIRLRTRGGDAGRQSGFFMSLSTAGSIAGTLLASYWLIPFYGVAETVAYTNVLFAAVLAATYLWSGRRSGAHALVACLPLALYFSAFSSFAHDRREDGVLYESDSFYGNIRIVAGRDAAGRPLLEYQPSRVYTHSVLYPDEPLRELPGLQYLVAPMPHPPRSILVLGSAAGGIIRQIEAVFPEAAVTGVDIDPKIHQVARDFFKVDTARARLVAKDARVFLAETAETYDFIIVDLFAGEFIPPHCVSLEFFRLVRSRLAPDGTVFVNTNMNDIPYELPEEREPFRPVRHLHATLRAAGFPALYENRYFHSLYAYPHELAEDRFAGALMDQFRDAGRPAALRAAAGLAAFTSAAVPSGRDRYRPYTDRWVPGPLVELKSNEQRIYAALGETPADAGAEPVPRLVLARILEEGGQSGYLTAVRDPARLVDALERQAGAEPAPDRATAARHFRYSPEMDTATADGLGAEARSPAARTAARYARLYRFAYANDYEGVLATLAVMDGKEAQAAAEE